MIYFDNASTSWPKPEIVLEGMKTYFYDIGVSPSRGGYQQARLAEDMIYETRKLLANMFNVNDPDYISFSYNATHALNIVIQGLLKEGDHVLISSFEHNSVIRPLEKLKADKKISYDVYECSKDGFFDTSCIESLIKENTRLIICNHASNVIGIISPIEEIGQLSKKHNLLFLVDCAQTAGLLEIDVKKCNINFLIGTGHKSLLGPSGVGFIYIENPDLIHTLIEGGSGHNSVSTRQPQTMPLKFEAGTMNYLGIAGLNKSLKHLNKESPGNIYAKEISLLQYLMDHLLQIEEITIYGTQALKYKIPLFSFNVRGLLATECSYLLDKYYSICTRGGLQCSPLTHKTINTYPHGTVRISLGHKNNYNEVDEFVKALKAIITTHCSKAV